MGYLFCLWLSYFRWDSKRQKGLSVNPWLLFEELSCIAAAQFVGGEVINFGTARGNKEKDKKAFRQRIDELCRCLGEGDGFREQDTLDRKDDHVDLVAWKGFSDSRTSKLIVFGQCASGNNWTSKDSELMPDAFWKHWMSRSVVSPLIKSFYFPHRIGDAHWQYIAGRAGILFDRCRIAYWAFRNNEAILSNPKFVEWYQLELPNPSFRENSNRVFVKPKVQRKTKAQI